MSQTLPQVGELKLQELRSRASSSLGDAFDLKEFHQLVLESVGPLDVVEEQVDEWIAAGGGTVE